MFEDQNQSFLGRGWSFPPAFDWEQKNVRMSEEEKDIRESLFIILSTIPGERVMRPKFGCDLHGMVFSPKNAETENKMINLVSTAVSTYEPRVIIESIEVNFDHFEMDGKVFILLEYTIIAVNSRANIVYPFYLLEGSHVENV